MKKISQKFQVIENLWRITSDHNEINLKIR